MMHWSKTARLAWAASMVVACAACAAPAAAHKRPAYAVPSYATAESVETLRGRISGFDGKYTLYLRDVRGFVDHVSLHDGTVILPTGLRLQAGMRARILGYAKGNTFVADEIDVPYHVAAAYPYYPSPPAWYGPGWYQRGWYGPGWYGGGWYAPYAAGPVIVAPWHHGPGPGRHDHGRHDHGRHDHRGDGDARRR